MGLIWSLINFYQVSQGVALRFDILQFFTDICLAVVSPSLSLSLSLSLSVCVFMFVCVCVCE